MSELSLSPRERTVLLLLANTGMSNRELGEHLYRSEKTIKSHLHMLTIKLGAKSRAELIVWAWSSESFNRFLSDSDGRMYLK